LIVPLAALALIVTACDEDNGNGIDIPEVDGGSPTVDFEAILNDAGEVRAMLEESASAFPPDLVNDAEFSDNTLTVTVGADAPELDDAAAFCEDVAGAISLADLSVRVVDEAGAELATCGTAAS
jgi:hypothetical protein